MVRATHAMALGIAVITLALSACSPVTPQTPHASASTTPPTNPAATPSNSPPTPEDAGEVEAPVFDESAAYNDCVTNSVVNFLGGSGDPLKVDFAPQSASQIVLRSDGRFYLYIEVENHNLDSTQPELVSAAAAECVVGTNIVPPEYALYMGSIRSPAESRDPNMSIEQHD